MITLTDTQIEIMGRPNFKCALIAKLLIGAGVYEDKAKKAEYEQAVYIHWSLGLVEQHGADKWQDAADGILTTIVKNLDDTPGGHDATA